jgi:2-dehydro-3-deoxyphosphooctonate aldolase (KDO 8-P synthase)
MKRKTNLNYGIENFDLMNTTPGLISGPCVLEGKDIVFAVAEELVKIRDTLGIPIIFKSSYLKDNRSSLETYQGPGIDEGLKLLEEVRNEFSLPVLTDVHSEEQVEVVSEVVDVLQIPAFLSRQTGLALACGRTGKPVNIKKGQFMAPDDIEIPIKKIETTGNNKIFLTERGACFGYGDIVMDPRNLYFLARYGYPVVADITHIVRIPGYTSTDERGGMADLIKPLSRCAVAFGCDMLFLEVHPQPSKGLCDAMSMLPLHHLQPLLKEVLRIIEAINTD